MLNIVLFGPPGAGKGTQSEMLIDRYQLIHLSTGDLFRKHLKEKTDLGLLAQQYMDEGRLVPDKVVIDMVDDKLNSEAKAKGYIFDGFPRTVAQAKALDQLMDHHGSSISVMLSLVVPEEELIDRILNRAKTSGRVDDQDMGKIKKRLEVYEMDTAPVAGYYEKQGKLRMVKGLGAIPDIFSKLTEVIDQHLN